MRRRPSGVLKRFSDSQLRAGLEAGPSAIELAGLYRVSRSAVYKRIKQLGLTTVAATMAPVESARAVKCTIDVFEQLAKGLERANLLMDACDRWLRSPENADEYDVSARSADTWVVYEETGTGPKGQP